MLKIAKVRFYNSDKYHNKYYVYTHCSSYIVKRPLDEKPLKSMDVIFSCKEEEDLFKIGACLPPKGGKISLQEYFLEKGLA
jgi:hypothetical protein